jgi:hypothetical protein
MDHVRNEALRQKVCGTPGIGVNSLVDTEVAFDLPGALIDAGHGSRIGRSSYILGPLGAVIRIAFAAHRIAQGIPPLRPLCATGGAKAQGCHNQAAAVPRERSLLGLNQTHRKS